MLPLAYGLRSLLVRRLQSLATLLGVALVVGVFCYLLCFADGLNHALQITGDPRNLIVLADGATAETNSALSNEDARRLISVPNVARADDGRPLVSPEVVVQTDVVRRGDRSGTRAGVVVRGIDLDAARAVHRGIELIAGRWFRDATDELVVGADAAGRFEGLQIGSTIDCGERTFAIVGLFTAGGSARGSELWGHWSNVRAAYRRERFSSAVVRLRTSDPAAIGAAVRRIESAGISLRAVPEREYFANQAQSAQVIRALATGLLLIMGAGAAFAATNALLASVAGRTREIGMLRAIGYSRRAVLIAILIESLLVALGGGLLGCLGCFVFIQSAAATGDLVATATFSSIAFDVRITGRIVALSLAGAAAIGLLGGYWPARAAAGLPVVRALRAT